MIATRKTRLPKVRTTLSTSAEIVGAELINSRTTHAQFGGDGGHVEFTGTKLCK